MVARTFAIGDRVRFSSRFLKSIQAGPQYDLHKERGTVTAFLPHAAIPRVRVRWQGGEETNHFPKSIARG